MPSYIVAVNSFGTEKGGSKTSQSKQKNYSNSNGKTRTGGMEQIILMCISHRTRAAQQISFDAGQDLVWAGGQDPSASQPDETGASKVERKCGMSIARCASL